MDQVSPALSSVPQYLDSLTTASDTELLQQIISFELTQSDARDNIHQPFLETHEFGAVVDYPEPGLPLYTEQIPLPPCGVYSSSFSTENAYSISINRDVPPANFLLESFESESHIAVQSSVLIPDLSRTSAPLSQSSAVMTTSRFPPTADGILKTWYEEHYEIAYPTKMEKAELMKATNLSTSQISAWFANARRREKRRVKRCNSDLEPRKGPLLPGRSNSIPEWNNMTPLDRWSHSPPDTEAVPLTAIAKAVAHETKHSKTCNQYRSDTHNHCSGPAESISSSRAPSSGSSRSRSSESSVDSTHFFGRFHSGVHRRRRRHRNPKSKLVLGSYQDDDERIYQCTFCTDTFKHKHDWTRHEKTLHLSLEKWTCTPYGPTFIDPHTGTPECALCATPYPSDDHFKLHRLSECREKPEATRTFYRKDHLIQHLRMVHGIDQFITSMQIWKSEIKHVNCRCGFCNARFLHWADRNTHIAKHFREGELMKDWKGCRGFDPGIAVLVENGMPPYLIGSEAVGVAPFRASGMNERHNDAGLFNELSDGGNSTATPFELLTVRLGQFIANSRCSKIIMTDQVLQQEACRIVYGDVDPWNQTAADNTEWLQMFKAGHGLVEDFSQNPGLSLDQLKHIQAFDADLHLSWTDESLLPIITTASNQTICPSIDSASLSFSSGLAIEPLTEGSTRLMQNIPWALQSPECLAEFRARLKFARCIDGGES
jgi:hypothetical protein